MVKRKPVNAGVNRTPSGLPYPVTPILPKESITEASASPLRAASAEESQTPGARLQSSNSTSDMANSTIAWANDHTPTKNTINELPSTSRVGEEMPPTGETHGVVSLPASLQAGHKDGTPRSSFESQNSASQTANRGQVRDPNQAVLGSSVQSHSLNNPFLRMRDNHISQPQASNVEGGSSADIWSETVRNLISQPPEAQASSELSYTLHLHIRHLTSTGI